MEKERNAVVIVFPNQKGGEGKTTTIAELAAALGELGRTSLIVDLTLGETAILGPLMEHYIGSFEFITGAHRAEDCIVTNVDGKVTLPHNVHLIPSSKRLAGLDQWQSQSPSSDLRRIFIDSVARLRSRYDYIFVDNSAPQTLLAILALTVADFAILTAMSGYAPDLALDEALRVISDAQKYANPKLKLLGMITCGFSRSNNSLTRDWIDYIAKTCVDSSGRSLKFDTEISRGVVIPKAQLARKSIFQFQSNHPIADEYRKLAHEFEERLKAQLQ